MYVALCIFTLHVLKTLGMKLAVESLHTRVDQCTHYKKEKRERRYSQFCKHSDLLDLTTYNQANTGSKAIKYSYYTRNANENTDF